MHNEDIGRQLLTLGEGWRRLTPPSLRLRIAGIAERASTARQAVMSETVPRPWIARRTMAFGTAGVIVLLLAIPFSRDMIARQASRVLQTLRIAPSTELVTDGTRGAADVNESLRDYHRQLGAGRMWSVHTAYGGFGGTVPPNASPDVRRIDRSDVLRSSTAIPLQAPEGPYRGQSLPFHHALLSPDGLVLAFFGSGSAEVLLLQAPVDGGQTIAFSRSVTGRDGVMKGVAPAIEKLSVGGQPVTWDPDTTGVNPNLSALRWEDAGVSYSLYGRALTKAEAVTLFSTLHPLN